MKRIISFLLIATIIISSFATIGFSTHALNSYGDTFTCGTSSKLFSWTLNDTTGVLAIRGEGNIVNSNFQRPWLGSINGIPLSGLIKTVYIEEGITGICENMFNYDFKRASRLTKAYLASSVVTISSNAFNGTGLQEITVLADNASIASGAIPQSATIYAHADSTAKSYAARNGNTFVALCREHTPILEGYVAPTCESAGYTGDMVCETCGVVTEQGSSIEALGHNYVLQGSVQPTCTEKGYTGDLKCTRCTVVQSYGSVIDELGHNCGDWQILNMPNCDKEGTKIRFCGRCDYYETSAIAQLGHNFGEWEVIEEATCSKEGKKERVCRNDNSHIETESIAKLAHNYKNVKIAATATQVGYTAQKCTQCGTINKMSEFTAPTGKQILKCKARATTAQTVTWNNVKTATGYQVQISTKDGKNWSTYATLKAGITAYTFKNLAAGNNYKFRVRFYIDTKEGNKCSPWSATLNSPTLPTGTTLTKLTPAKKAFTAQWKKNATVTGYQIQYSLKSNFSGAKIITVKSPKTLKSVAKKLYAGKYYYVRIRTYKTIAKVNYFSTWSKTDKVKTK